MRAAVGHVRELAAVAATDAAPGVAGATGGLWRVELTVASIEGEPVRARVAVWGVGEWSTVVRGEALVLAGVVDASDRGTAAVMWRPRIESREGPRGIDAVVAHARAGLREVTDGLPERLRPLVRGMVIGDDSGMSRDQRDEMAAAGLTHLTAVSGSHFAIVLVAVTTVLRLVARSRRIVAVVTAGAMAALVCVVFPEPSVVRAATMAGAICLAMWWGRPAQALPALSAGVTVVALVDPRLACEPGFAMSVAAVAAIALWAPALAARLARVVPALIAEPLAVCIAAQAAVLPLLSLIGGGVGPWAIAANLAVGWFAAPVTLLGLAALVVAPASPPAAELLARLAGWCDWPVDAAARGVDRLPGAELSVPPGAWAAVASGLVLGAATALTFTTRVRLSRRLVAAIAFVAALAIALGSRLLGSPVPADWLVVACDVGQGDAMLLRSGPGAAVVIDVGPQGGGAVECLRRYGVRRVDLLVITHPHADHVGGLREVLEAVAVAEAWVSPAQPEETTAVLERAGVPVMTARAGDARVAGWVDIAALAPAGAATTSGSTGLNDASVVTLASVGGVTVLALGDLEHEGQRALAARLPPAAVDLVKVPHHGSDRQEAALAELVTARLAIVSVGAGNTYGHPAPDALELWGSRATLMARTDLCGDVVVVPGLALAAACPTGMAG